MKSIVFHALCGMAVALAARVALPGHSPEGPLLSAILGATGGLGADWFGRRAGLYGADQAPSFVMSVLGAMALMLVYGVVGH